MLKKILLGLLLILVVLVVIGFVLPKDFEVTRSTVIAAPSDKVHALVGDLKGWAQWGPWHEEDPTIQTTYGAQTSGVGGSMKWTGEGGDGWLRLTKTDPATGVEYDMAFLEDGKEIPAKGAVSYQPAAGGTQVSWGMQGTMNMPVIGGWMALCSGWMIGPMFEKGLANLKAKVEAK